MLIIMKKRILLLWLLLSTTIWTFAYDFKSGDLCYNITSDSTVEVTYQRKQSSDNYRGLTSATIPESITYNGTTYRVTSIGECAFWSCSGLTSITISNSVTSIGRVAFNGCRGLTSITIGNSVTSIGWNAFSGCSGLTSITIPNSVTSIGNNAFEGCSGLTSVVWNAKNYADFTNDDTPFYYVNYSFSFDLRSQITSFVFGDSVQHIPAYICSGMNKLTSLTIGNNVTSIGSSAFSGCTSLAKTNYTGDIAGWYNIDLGADANPIRYSRNFFINNVLVTDLVIPEGITTINNAFRFDTCLTSVTIPNSVTSVGGCAFEGCRGLTSITRWRN